jgi:Uma2 family endonuclease
MVLSTIDLKPIVDLSDEQFYQLCRSNPEVNFERNADGKIEIMSPTGGETGNRNFEIGADLAIWNRQTRLGVCFDSSTCFKLPNGANRSPDIAWIQQERWQALTPQDRERFPPIAPDFVLELRSASDSLSDLQGKMQEYQENGVRLGWLIDRKNRQVYIYRQHQQPETLSNPSELSGEEVLPGFTLSLANVW